MIKSVAFLFIFLASYCNAYSNDINITTHIDPEFEDESYERLNEIPKLDDTKAFGPNAVRDFYIVLIFGLVAFQLNLFGSLYVIYRTYLQWKRCGKNSLPLSLRFPFYIALTDALLSLGYTINLSYTLVHKLPWSNPACRIIGTSVVTLFTLNIFLVGIIAVTTWCYVCREYYIGYGPYDYKLWTVTSALSILIIYFSLDKTGQQKYWCAGRHNSNFVPVIMIISMFIILSTILFCYIKVLLKIRSSDELLIAHHHQQRARVEKRALRKLISYIFTFLLQFIPLLAYNFFIIITIENLLLEVLAITTTNFGGIGNFIQFVINEGLFDSNKSNSPISSMVKEQNIQTRSTVREIDDTTPVHEIRDHIEVNQPNTNNNFGETTPGLISEVSNDVTSNKDLEDEKPNENTIEINIDTCDELGDNESFYDAATAIDASANSSDNLLNRDDYFCQDLREYNKNNSNVADK